MAAASVSEAEVFRCSGGDVPCLVAAINAANANGQVNTIRLAEGVYTLTAADNETDGPNGLPSVTSTLTITGVDPAVDIVERAATAPLFRVFHVGAKGVLTLRRLTVRGGSLTGDSMDGPGVLSNGTLHISDSVIAENRHLFQRGYGKGSGVAGTTLSLTRTTIRQNSGGVSVSGAGNLTVRNSTIADNDAQSAPGGIYFHSSGRLTILDTTITGNKDTSRGGGALVIDVDGAVAVIRNSTIARNASPEVGGILVAANSTVDIERSAIVDNTAFDHDLFHGSGISAFRGTVTVRESTIARNVNYGSGGAGLDIGGEASATVTSSTIVENEACCFVISSVISGAGINGNVRLGDTVLARNKYMVSTPPDVITYAELNCFGPITSLGHNLISDPNRCGDLQPTDIVANPGLGDFIDPGRPGTAHYPLLAGTLAIDAGTDEACSRRDQQGLVRGIDGDGDSVRRCDIGAIEFYPAVNEWVQLDGMHATFVPPDPKQRVNPLAAGGTYVIDATFTNVGGENICRAAFEVATLDVPSGVASVLTRTGDLIGREGIEFPATLAGKHANLRPADQERYRFTIGVTEPVPMTFFVNMLGERTAGRCALPQVPDDDARPVNSDYD
jgi:parallel beta-helix repeat protein